MSTGAVYLQNDKNHPYWYVASWLQNKSPRVGMCSPERGIGQILICHPLVAMETDEFYRWWSPWDPGRDGEEMREWVVDGDNSSLCVSNVTGGDRHRVRGPSFNPNDKARYHSLSCCLPHPQCCVQDQARGGGPLWGNCERGEKTFPLCLICGRRREQAIVSGSVCQLNAFNKNVL